MMCDLRILRAAPNSAARREGPCAGATGRLPAAQVQLGVLLGILLGALAAGGAGPAEAAAAKASCLDAGGYKVAYRERTMSVGSDIVVHPPGGACGLKSAGGGFKVLADDAAYVKGAAGTVLVLDVGTGPDRVLVLYDVAKRAELLRTDYDDDTPLEVKADSVAFSAITGPGTKADCPQFDAFTANGLTPMLARRTLVSLPAGTRTQEGPTRCVARQ